MRPPVATYRLQFNSSFGFKAAKDILPYLSGLGISDIYASPIFKAKRGSSHGYDVVDQNLLNPELGTPEEFEDLIREVKAQGMGWVQDIVPNHMSYSHENEMLCDVLERGNKSRYYEFFDIDWDHSTEGLKGKLLAPFLGDLYGKTLEKGEIRLSYDEAGFSVIYFDFKLPLRLLSYADVLSQGLINLEKKLGERDQELVNLKRVILEAKEEDPDPGLKRKLWELYQHSPEIRNFVDSSLTAFNGSPTDPDSFNLLDKLLSEQLFRLCFWKVASDEINYKRFFIMNDLISLHSERKEIFDHIHSYTFDLAEKGKITGLRIDHIDGLYDPAEYLRETREKLKEGYLVVEKVLLPGEELPASWPVQGTTGYDFLNHQNGITCDKSRRDEFEGLYSQFTGANTSYDDVVYDKKKLIADRHMSGDIDNLARLVKIALGKDRHARDITLSGIKKALTELLILFPVYRIYVRFGEFAERDRNIIIECVRRAKDRNLDLFNELDFLEHFLLQSEKDGNDSLLRLLMKFQQFTGSLMAKGVEDTALYIYNRLISQNEVGGDPGSFGITLDEFHRFNIGRSKNWPDAMNATSTHDTKRGEDARARINVLSEMPEDWERHIDAWSRINVSMKKKVKGKDVPEKNDEYLLYQSLIGAFPTLSDGTSSDDFSSFKERSRNYLIKAVREAKVHSGWVKPDRSYEKAFVSFLDAILDSEEFMVDFGLLQRKVAYHGFLNSLTQTLVKMTAPGIPDFYQGTELWDYSYVDPDNRRPVDFGKRRVYLDEIKKREEKDITGLIGELMATMGDGRVKLFLIHRVLKARRENADLFSKGSYTRLGTEGENQENIIAFVRVYKDAWALTVAPRLTTALSNEGETPPDNPGWLMWGDARLIMPKSSPISWKNAITGQAIRGGKEIYLRDVLGHFPVALLLSKEEG